MTESVVLRTAELAWESGKMPGTGEAKILRDDAPGHAKTMLVRLQAGREIVPHCHLGVVQHYVLDGEYQSEGTSYPAGTYRRFPKDADIAPISTKNGATILMIYDPIA